MKGKLYLITAFIAVLYTSSIAGAQLQPENSCDYSPASSKIMYSTNISSTNNLARLNPQTGEVASINTMIAPTAASALHAESGYIYYVEWHATDTALYAWDPCDEVDIDLNVSLPSGSRFTRGEFISDSVILFGAMDQKVYEVNIGVSPIIVSHVGTITGLLDGGGDFAKGADGLLYIVSLQSLFTIDTNTWEATSVGTIDTSGFSLTGIAFRNNGELLVSTADKIFVVNPQTADVITTFSVSSTTLNDLAGVSQYADLSIELEVDLENVPQNDNVVYTISLTNSGPDLFTMAKIEALLPAGMTYVNHNGDGLYSHQTGLWAISDLPLGETAVIEITAQAVGEGTVLFEVQVSDSSALDPNSTPGNSDPSEDDYASVSVNILVSEDDPIEDPEEEDDPPPDDEEETPPDDDTGDDCGDGGLGDSCTDIGQCNPNQSEDCIYESLTPIGCVGANGFLGMVNILTVINLNPTPLSLKVQYRDWHGIIRGTRDSVIDSMLKQDFVVNAIGLEPDTYGTVCVITDADTDGAWTASITLYKNNYRSGEGGRDFALNYPVTNPRTGVYTSPLNTFHLGTRPDSTVANWINITDGAPGNGYQLTGKLFYYNIHGNVVHIDEVKITDGGRFDYSGHDALTGFTGSDEVGMVTFVPNNLPNGDPAKYYFTNTRYKYECFMATCTDFYTAFVVPHRPPTTKDTFGGVSTIDGEISIVELNNVTDSHVRAFLNVFNEAGNLLGIEERIVPPLGTRHVIINKVGESGFLQDNNVGSVEISTDGGYISATTFFYNLAY
jgi:uncharacterized repeat protein (TIGR01451 family)